MQFFVKHASNLGNIIIPLNKRTYFSTELIALLLMYLYHRRMKWNYNMKIVGIDFGSICPVLKPEKVMNEKQLHRCTYH